MSLIAWNCRGLGSPRTVRFLREITQQIKPSFIFLSETLAKKSRVIEVCKTINYAGCWVVESQGQSGGLALIWKNEGSCTLRESNTHFIDFEVENEQVGRWRYTGFYGCPEWGRKRESWNVLRTLAEKSNLPWCVIGDFNNLMYANEKRGGPEYPRSMLTGFVETLMECNLMDLGFTGERYTWEKSRGTSHWVQERLDRGVATQAWSDLFPDAEIKVLEVAPSDHLPLNLQLNRQVYMPKAKRFRFENVWIKEKDCLQLIKNSWASTEGETIMSRIQLCCIKLEEWGGGVKQEFRDKLANCKKRLRQLRTRRDMQGAIMYKTARWEYLNLLEKQEIYWKQRAKQFWLREGDQNTRFFHKYAATRKRANTIQRIQNSEGEWKETIGEIQDVITEYFSGLFQSEGNDGDLSQGEKVKEVTDEENEGLIAEVT
ncbi:uncharacterized protein LOC141679922 [Apium graveolens]|uniref:uncharacterized protein LOC141679922 n=1 Tax=Apium graveolens TaxID=4045 RepID=UPI003D7B293F